VFVCSCSCACVRAGEGGVGGEGGHTDACRLNRNSNLLRLAFLSVCLLFRGLGLMPNALFTIFTSVLRNMEFQSPLSRFLCGCLLFAGARLDSCFRGLDLCFVCRNLTNGRHMCLLVLCGVVCGVWIRLWFG